MDQDSLNRINAIKKYSNQKGVLSIYLGSNDKRALSGESALQQFKSLISNIENDKYKLFEKEIIKIETFLSNEWKPDNRKSIIIFASENDLWEVFSYEFGIKPEFHISNTPVIESLMRELQKHSSYLLILIDKRHTIFIDISLGEVQTVEKFQSEKIPKRMKAKPLVSFGMRGQLTFMKNQIKSYIKDVSEYTNLHLSKISVSFILIGGNIEMVKRLSETLPKDIRRLVFMEYPAQLNIPINDNVLKSKQIAGSLLNIE